MKNFKDKGNLDTLKNEINTAIQAIATKHNLTMKVGGISYMDANCTIKIEAAVTDSETKQKQHGSLFSQYGLEESLLGQQFTHRGSTFIIDGINTRCTKSPIILRGINGTKDAKCSPEFIMQVMKLQPAPKSRLTKVDVQSHTKNEIYKALKRNETSIRNAVKTHGSYDPNEILYLFEESLYGSEVTPITNFLNYIVKNNLGFGHNYLEVVQVYLKTL